MRVIAFRVAESGRKWKGEVAPGARARHISVTDRTGNQSYFLYDGLESTANMTDGSGNTTATYGYDVFGAVRSESGSGAGANEGRFTGEQRDKQTGRQFYYLRARYYDAAIGRFLSQDPIEAGHRYSYVGNAPTNYIDPMGTCRVEVRAKRLFLFGTFIPDAYHLFIYTQDPIDGSEIAYRGGNDRPVYDPFGATPATIRAVHSDWGPRFPDYSATRDDPTAVVADTGGSCAGIRRSLNNKERQINAAKIPYTGLGKNSNATARTLLRAAGLPEVLPATQCFKWEEHPASRLLSDVLSGGCTNSVWAPGWEEPLFTR